MTISWKLSAGSSLTSYFLDMWKTPTLESLSNCLEAFHGQFILRLVYPVLVWSGEFEYKVRSQCDEEWV